VEGVVAFLSGQLLKPWQSWQVSLEAFWEVTVEVSLELAVEVSLEVSFEVSSEVSLEVSLKVSLEVSTHLPGLSSLRRRSRMSTSISASSTYRSIFRTTLIATFSLRARAVAHVSAPRRLYLVANLLPFDPMLTARFHPARIRGARSGGVRGGKGETGKKENGMHPCLRS